MVVASWPSLALCSRVTIPFKNIIAGFGAVVKAILILILCVLVAVGWYFLYTEDQFKELEQVERVEQDLRLDFEAENTPYLITYHLDPARSRGLVGRSADAGHGRRDESASHPRDAGKREDTLARQSAGHPLPPGG